MRRQWKRWAWALVVGTAAVGGAARAADKPADKPVAEWKVGDTVPWNVVGQADKKVTVTKVTKKPDGTIEAELKDGKGDTFTLVEGPAAAKPATPAAVPPPADKPAAPVAKKDAAPPKAKPRAEDPLTAATPPEPPAPPVPPAPEGKKPRLIGRLLGKKAPPPPPAPVSAPAAPAEAPAVAPKVAVPAKPTAPKVASPGADVPAAMPAKPVAPARVEPVLPPTPAIPVPAPLPGKPAGSDAIPVPLPSIPSPGGSPQAAAPLVPGRPVEVVLPVGYVPADVARAEDIQPHAVALKTAIAPSQRLLAAKALAGGRHASSDVVKGLLFDAAKADPCPAVRADCLGYLCDLGYFTPAFAEVVKAACDDPSDEVKEAAKAARAKMTRR